MAKSNQFLKIFAKNGGSVEGECYDEKHLREIDLLSWHWDVEDPAVPKSSTKGEDKDKSKAKPKGDAAGESDRKPKPSKFAFSKATDRSTTRLLGAMDKGEIFPRALLTIEERYEESPLAFYMEVELTDVIVVDFKWHGTAEGAGSSFNEDWELNYSNIEFRYHWRQGEKGWIHQQFDRPPDAADGSSIKSPLSAAEKNAMDTERIKGVVKKLDIKPR